MNIDLNSLLEEYGCKNPDSIKETVISECELSVFQVRDALFLLGNILYESLEDQIYVATISAGYWNLSSAVVAVKLNNKNLYVSGYAKEGLIKQNICERAFQKLADAAHGKKVKSSGKRKWLSLPIIVMVILASIAINARNFPALKFEVPNDDANRDLPSEEEVLNAEIELVLSATEEYNDAVEMFNQCVEEYNNAVQIASIDNIEGFPASITKLSVVSENREDIEKVVQSNNSKDKIAADTETILEMTKQVRQALTVIGQITAPSGEWVETQLAGIEEIIDTQAVTVEQNPDGLLGKEGGYSACIYFTVAEAVPEEVQGDSIVEKGTDAGGAIEIYDSLADAEARVAYLAGFDGTVLYSGSYAIIGTMVIRTSYKLSNEQQWQITNLITTEMTKLTEIE